MNWVRHGGSTTFETKSSYCRVARQGLPCYTAVARLGFKRRTTTVLKLNLIGSIEFNTAVAWRPTSDLQIDCLQIMVCSCAWPWKTLSSHLNKSCEQLNSSACVLIFFFCFWLFFTLPFLSTATKPELNFAETLAEWLFFDLLNMLI